MSRLIVALALFISASVLADTVYVIDTLTVRLRSGPGTNFEVAHPGVNTGQALTLTGEARNGWSQVRIGNTNGWILDSYIQDEPVFRDRFAQLESQYTQLRAEHDDMLALGPLDMDSISGLRRDLEMAKTERDDARFELDRVMAVSSNVVDLDSRNQQLIEQNRNLQNQLQQIQAENTVLRESHLTRQWLIGGLLVMMGALLTALLRLLRPRGRSHDTWV